MNADPTTLRKSHRLFRKAVMSVFAHDLPHPEPFRRASRELDETFLTLLDFIPNQAFFPVHLFRFLCRLRRVLRRWTALIPRVVKPPQLSGTQSLPPIIHCPNPWAKSPQISTTSISAKHQSPRAAAHTDDTHNSSMSIPKALQHERRQAWKLAIPLPRIHPPKPLAPQSQSRRLVTPEPARAGGRLAGGGRRRPWSGWKELPGPPPQTCQPAQPDPSPFDEIIAPPASANHQLDTSAMSRRNEMKADPSTKSSHHPSRATRHEPRSGSASLLSSPFAYQRQIDRVLLHIVITLTRALLKTRKLADKDPHIQNPHPHSEKYTKNPQPDSIPSPPNEDSLDAPPDYWTSMPFFIQAAETLGQLVRERLEAIWRRAHTPHPTHTETQTAPAEPP